MRGSVVIDCFPESAQRYRDDYVIVAIDVIRATTTATTAVSLGRPVFPARSVDDASQIASGLTNPLLVGEVGGNMPYGFDLTNSPALVARRDDVHRPMVFVSSSGTALVREAEGSRAVYLACFRNLTAVAGHLAERRERVAVIGAGTRGQFRREDQMGCAWVAEQLLQAGYGLEDRRTEEYVARWRGVSPEEVRFGRSAEYLTRSGQTEDLEFVLAHIDDLRTVPVLQEGLLVDGAAKSRPSAVVNGRQKLASGDHCR